MGREVSPRPPRFPQRLARRSSPTLVRHLVGTAFALPSVLYVESEVANLYSGVNSLCFLERFQKSDEGGFVFDGELEACFGMFGEIWVERI